MTALFVILAIASGLVLYLLGLSRIHRKIHRSPAPPHLGRFLDSGVLDLGCGSSAFTTFVARAVGEQGKVYAVDLQKRC